jgi:hypothetical protein
MTVGSFILGLVFFAAGFYMLWRTRIFEEYAGDLATLLGAADRPWISWKLLGVVIMFVGVIIMFGLLPLIFGSLFGNASRLRR